MDRFESIRKLKTSVFGASKSADDDFNQTRQEILQYKRIIQSLQDTIVRFEKDIRDLASGHEKLLSELPQFDTSEKSLKFARAVETMNKRIARLDMTDLKLKVFRTAGELKQLSDLIDKRDFALSEKKHYDEKIAKISDAKKFERNNAKQDTATRTYNDLNDQVNVQSRAVLDRRIENVQGLLQQYSTIYQSLFKDIHEGFSVVGVGAPPRISPRTTPSAPPMLEETFNYR
jgi:archaellum component FlaC